MKKTQLSTYFILTLFLINFGLVWYGTSKGDTQMQDAGFMLIPVTLTLFMIVLFVIPRLRSRKALKAFAQKVKSEVVEKPDLVFPDIFYRNDPYHNEKRNILGHPRNLIQLPNDIKIFLNTQSIWSQGANKIQEHLCFLLPIKSINGYHIIKYSTYPYAIALDKYVGSIAKKVFDAEKKIIEVKDLKNYIISSSDEQAALEIVNSIRPILIRIDSVLSSDNIPGASEIDYDKAQFVIDLTQNYAYIRMDYNLAVYIDKIHPIFEELRQELLK